MCRWGVHRHKLNYWVLRLIVKDEEGSSYWKLFSFGVPLISEGV